MLRWFLLPTLFDNHVRPSYIVINTDWKRKVFFCMLHIFKDFTRFQLDIYPDKLLAMMNVNAKFTHARVGNREKEILSLTFSTQWCLIAKGWKYIINFKMKNMYNNQFLFYFNCLLYSQIEIRELFFLFVISISLKRKNNDSWRHLKIPHLMKKYETKNR